MSNLGKVKACELNNLISICIFQLPQLAPKNGTIIPRYALLLNNLLEAVAVESPGSLNLSIFNVELLSSLGRFHFSPDVLELLAQQIKSGLPDGHELGSSGSSAEPYVMMFGSMGHLICGFLDEDLTKVLFIQGRNTINFLGCLFTLVCCSYVVSLPLSKVLKQVSISDS